MMGESNQTPDRCKYGFKRTNPNSYDGTGDDHPRYGCSKFGIDGMVPPDCVPDLVGRLPCKECSSFESKLTYEEVKEEILSRIADGVIKDVIKKTNNQIGTSLQTVISIQSDQFEGPAIRDERSGDVRVTLNTKEGMKRLHLSPRQARELLDALVAWMDAVQE